MTKEPLATVLISKDTRVQEDVCVVQREAVNDPALSLSSSQGVSSLQPASCEGGLAKEDGMSSLTP